MTRLFQLLGGFANSLGIPGFVRKVEYHSDNFGTRVAVRVGRLFTVVSVDGTDVYFNRFSGEIDGVGFSRTSGCKLHVAARLERFVAQRGQRNSPTQTQTPPEPAEQCR